VSAAGIIVLAGGTLSVGAVVIIERSSTFQNFRRSGTVYGKSKNVKNNVSRSQDGKKGSKFGNDCIRSQLGFRSFEDRGRHCNE